jgi:hypothetical protein
MSVIYGAQAGQGGSHDLQDGPEAREVSAAVTPVCSGCVLRSLGQTGAGPAA